MRRMRAPVTLASIALVVVLLVVMGSAAQTVAPEVYDAESCAKLGFDRAVVQCRFCDLLYNHTGSAELRHECRACCTESTGEDTTSVPTERDKMIYIRAQIESSMMDSLLRNDMTEIGRFARKYAKEPYFKLISFRKRSSVSRPRLVLINDREEMVSMLIESWSADNIHDFLQLKLNFGAKASGDDHDPFKLI